MSRFEPVVGRMYVVYLGETAKSRFVHMLLAPNGVVMKTGAFVGGQLKELGE